MDTLASSAEVAAYLKKPVQTLYAWRSQGTGPPATRVGRHLLYRWSDVEQWLKELKEQETSKA